MIVCLLANQFWKPGFVRDLYTFLVCLAISFVIIRFGLMEFTNYGRNGIEYDADGYATSILASAHAYFLLVVTAAIASQANLRHGWDFAGILVPALLALLWFTPARIAATFVEAFVVCGAAAALLRLPFFADVNVEGARKIALFFTVAFTYRMVLGWIGEVFELDVEIEDYYGFGYLLSTLMAIKMYEKAMVVRLPIWTVLVSFLGFASGTAIAASVVPIATFAPMQAVSAVVVLGREMISSERTASLEERPIAAAGFPHDGADAVLGTSARKLGASAAGGSRQNDADIVSAAVFCAPALNITE